MRWVFIDDDFCQLNALTLDPPRRRRQLHAYRILAKIGVSHVHVHRLPPGEWLSGLSGRLPKYQVPHETSVGRQSEPSQHQHQTPQTSPSSKITKQHPKASNLAPAAQTPLPTIAGNE
jgi:hypothetical protein